VGGLQNVIILYIYILTRCGGGSDDRTFADDVPVWDVSVDDDVGGRTAVLSNRVTTAAAATASPETACGHHPVATNQPGMDISTTITTTLRKAAKTTLCTIRPADSYYDHYIILNWTTVCQRLTHHRQHTIQRVRGRRRRCRRRETIIIIIYFTNNFDLLPSSQW